MEPDKHDLPQPIIPEIQDDDPINYQEATSPTPSTPPCSTTPSESPVAPALPPQTVGITPQTPSAPDQCVLPVPRPQRQKKPNSLLSGDVWDLSTMGEDLSTMTSYQGGKLLGLMMQELRRHMSVLDAMGRRLAQEEGDK